MLVASAKHPAMLIYLDNAEARPGRPERELRARAARAAHRRRRRGLHRGGHAPVGAGSSRASASSWDTGAFEYHPSDHFTGRVDVLGCARGQQQRDANGEGSRPRLRALPRAPPGDRERIARKLAVRFVCDDPPAALVKRWPRSTSTTTPRSCRCCAKLFRSRAFEALDRREGAPAVRGHGLDRAGRSASRPDAERDRRPGSPLLAVRVPRPAAAGLAPARRLPRRRRPVALRRRHAGPLEHPHGLAAGWWPANDLKAPNPSSSAAAPAAPDDVRRRSSTRSRSGCVLRPLAAAHRAAILRVPRATATGRRCDQTTRP